MTPTIVRYCLNGCTVRSGTEKVRARTEGPSQLCHRCEESVARWLGKIPDNYALLPTFIEPGSAEKNPESQSTKAAYVGTPARLEIIDLLDHRHGRIWKGTAPAHDRRGVVGTLLVHVERLVEERPLTKTPVLNTVSQMCALLARHRLWIFEQDWSPLLHEDLKQLDRQLSDAIGDYRRPPVGRCQLVHEGAEKACDGGLYASDYAGVHCVRCGATWDASQLRLLGMALGEAAGA